MCRLAHEAPMKTAPLCFARFMQSVHYVLRPTSFGLACLINKAQPPQLQGLRFGLMGAYAVR